MEILRKYGEAATIVFPLVDRGALDLEATPVTFVAADTQISKDEGAFADTDSTPAHEGNGFYSLALTATEMEAARIMISCIDGSTPKLWEDQGLVISTYGNASAQHALDLGTASVAQTGDTYALANGATGFAAIDTVVDAILVDTGTSLPALVAALNDISIADILAMNYEGSETLQDYLRLTRAPLLGKASGLNTASAAYRDAADTKDRITATVDEYGNRTAVTTDAS